jgi:hypothetical protein
VEGRFTWLLDTRDDPRATADQRHPDLRNLEVREHDVSACLDLAVAALPAEVFECLTQEISEPKPCVVDVP